ncbi:protein Stu1p [[Candida] jaroonii]|uniref:Protein Stu1p n=1 Tax=[Candida] jaroonii TaxID=467808 RepID=A0ACA9Y7Z3_9ASCO|nr:protein Stu1p [[Candida] jaroonii]
MDSQSRQSPPEISGEEAYATISSSNIPTRTKTSLIRSLRSQFKRGTVDFNHVNKYLDTLLIALDIDEIKDESYNMFHPLLKRIATQRGDEYLRNYGPLIIPHLIERLSTHTQETKSALETFYLVNGCHFEESFNKFALSHKNPKIVIEAIDFLEHLCTIKKQFTITPFIPSIVSALNTNNNDSKKEVVEGIISFLSIYYGLQIHRFDKNELTKEMSKQSIDGYLKEKVMSSINSTNMENTKSNPQVSRFSNRSQASVTYPPIVDIINKPEKVELKVPVNNTMSDPEISIHNDSEDELKSITSSLVKYDFNDSLYQARNIISEEDLRHRINRLLPAFTNKETEQNWMLREKAMIALREFIRGNAITEFLDDFKESIREMSEGINKSILSLRTTLSAHGCQFIKELAILLKSSFDSLAELFFPALFKLCNATKNLASLNAHTAISAIFINCPFSSRYMNKIYNSSSDKNTKLRSYSGTWLQIMLINHHTMFRSPSHSQQQPELSHIEVTVRMLIRLLSDPNPGVRQCSKDAFWTLGKYFPKEKEHLISKLEPNVVKAIQRFQPKPFVPTHRKSASYASDSFTHRSVTSTNNHDHPNSHQPTNTHTAPTNRPRVSIMEGIRAQNKDLKERQRESRPFSRTQSLKEREKSPARISRANSHTRKAPVEKMRTNLEKPKLSREPWKPTVATAPIQRTSSAMSDKESEPKSRGSYSIKSSEEIPDDFDSQSDPIYHCLSSKKPDLIQEGISLLIYAIQANEVFNVEINTSLTEISYSNVELLGPLFKEIKLRKLKQFFHIDDFFRTFTLLVKPITSEIVKDFSDIVGINDMFKPMNKLLKKCVDINGSSSSNPLLTNQLIKYKSTIILSIIEFINSSINKIPMKDNDYSLMIINLFSLVELIKSTPLYEQYSNLLVELYNMNNGLFSKELSIMSSSIRQEIGIIVDFDGLTDFNNTLTRELNGNLDLTKVIIPNISNINTSPVKGMVNDLTMIIPVNGGESFKSIKMNSIKEDDMEIDSSNNYGKILESSSQEIKQLKPSPELIESSVFNDSQSTNKSELVDDFRQVTITDKHNFIKDPLQLMVDKVDPLKSLSDKNKPIDIYEDDTNYRGSPKKYDTKYDHTELNWFNFQLVNLKVDDSEFSKRDFDYYCKILSDNTIGSNDYYKLLNVLQSSSQFDMDFTNYFYGEGLSKIENGLWSFFNKNLSVNYNSSNTLKGLIILKQLLINKVQLDHDKIFQLLNHLCEFKSHNIVSELDHALKEIFEEMISTGKFNSNSIEKDSKLLDVILHEIKKLEDNDDDTKWEKLFFNLDCLEKIISGELINDEVMNNIDDQIFKYINNDKLEIRRLVILIYGKMTKYCKQDIGKITLKLTPSQRKLVDYYSEL